MAPETSPLDNKFFPKTLTSSCCSGLNCADQTSGRLFELRWCQFVKTQFWHMNREFRLNRRSNGYTRQHRGVTSNTPFAGRNHRKPGSSCCGRVGIEPDHGTVIPQSKSSAAWFQVTNCPGIITLSKASKHTKVTAAPCTGEHVCYMPVDRPCELKSRSSPARLAPEAFMPDKSRHARTVPGGTDVSCPSNGIVVPQRRFFLLAVACEPYPQSKSNQKQNLVL